jgi:transcriptional regulator with XRE-family HTH domain
LRDAKNVTDYRVAEVSGVPKSTFSDWKSGRSRPKLEKLAKIADAIEASLVDLMEESNDDQT